MRTRSEDPRLARLETVQADAPARGGKRLLLAWGVAASGYAALALMLALSLAQAFAPPAAGADLGAPTADAAAPPSPPSPMRPYVAIVIDDVGLDAAAARAAMALPARVSLAILPYAAAAPQIDAEARAAGDETLLHLPMEPLGLEDPGPDALTTWLTPEAIGRRTADALDRVPGAAGLSNHMGSRFTTCAACLAPVAAAAAERGLYVLDSKTIAGSRLAEAARAAGAPALSRDVFLDNDPSEEAVLVMLAAAERRARAHGAAVAIGHPKPGTLAALARWIPEAEARGITVGAAGGVLAGERPPTGLRVASAGL